MRLGKVTFGQPRHSMLSSNIRRLVLWSNQTWCINTRMLSRLQHSFKYAQTDKQSRGSTVHRRNVDNSAPLVLCHGGENKTCGMEHRVQVDIDDGIPLVEREINHRCHLSIHSIHFSHKNKKKGKTKKKKQRLISYIYIYVGRTCWMPALLTRISTLPSFFKLWFTKLSTSLALSGLSDYCLLVL